MINLQSLTSPRLCVFQSRLIPGGFNSNWHEHDFFELGMVLQGTSSWHFRRKKQQSLTGGQGILLPPGASHRESGLTPVRFGWVGFDLASTIPARHLNRPITLGASAGDVAYLLQLIYEEQHSQQTGSAEICALALRQILILFQRAASEHPAPKDGSSLSARQVQVVQSLAAYLDQNISHPHSLEQVAEYHRLSPAHLSLLFQRHYHITPTAYRLQRRLDRAQELLGESSRSIKEIATACGFTDAAHFCKEFKKRTGHTPGEARSGKS